MRARRHANGFRSYVRMLRKGAIDVDITEAYVLEPIDRINKAIARKSRWKRHQP